MINQIKIINFRQIKDECIDLSSSVVIVGPNNSGKTTLLQAISLFALTIRTWGEKQINPSSKKSRSKGIAINREDLLNIPISEFKELWKDLNVRKGVKNKQGKPITQNIHIEIHAKGFTRDGDGKGQKWHMGFEYDYSRDSLIYARPAKDSKGSPYAFPDILLQEHIGYLPSVAALKPVEDKLELGSILRNIGNGNTSDVLRNICYHLYEGKDKTRWEKFRNTIKEIFTIDINPPLHSPATGLLKMNYNEDGIKNIDLSSLGSGGKQAILLFAYILAFPNTVNLLDEPDAHLEVIRQSNIYDRISDLAKENDSQIIVASHSESVLNRAFVKDRVISSVLGGFKQVNQSSRIRSVLRDYGYEELIIAKQRPFIVYVEGVTDLGFLKAFAKKLGKTDLLDFWENKVYPYPVGGDDTDRVKNHFSVLKEFIPELRAYALFDNLEKSVESGQSGLMIRQWERREMENYLPLPETMYEYVDSRKLDILGRFKEIVEDKTPPVALRDKDDNFWKRTKISDDYLTPIFEHFFDDISYPPGTMDKSKYHLLVDYCDPKLIDPEVTDVLDEIQQWRMG